MTPTDTAITALQHIAAGHDALRHTCKHLCQWKDACEVGCPVSVALADTTNNDGG